MAGYTQPAWYDDRSNDNYITIRDFASGNVICLLPTDTAIRPIEETRGNAALIALVPELFRCVDDFEGSVLDRTHGIEIDDELSDVIDDAQALLSLLAGAGVTVDEPPHDGIVVLPLPMMSPPATVLMFKTVDGNVTVLVHANDQPKTNIGQWNISSEMHSFVHTFLLEDGPLCGVLRHEKKVVGEITFMTGHLLKLTLGDCSLTTELDPEDTADIINLFRES